MKVAICLPVYDAFRPETTASLIGLVAHMLTNGDAPEIAVNWRSQTRIAPAREQLAEQSVNQGADLLLWIDSDMTFPADALARLMAHDLPFVGANYVLRRGANMPAAWKGFGETTERVWPKSEGVEAVDGIGFGLCLMKAEILQAMSRPWFEDGPHGEDAWFCQKARKAGIPIHVDHALSMETGHIAETVLRFPS